MNRFVIVQHAEKDSGPGDPGLSVHGLEQAAALADYLSTLEIAAIWTSPLRRALETAMPISERFGLSLVTDERLRERMNWGGTQSSREFLAEWTTATHDRYFKPQSGELSFSAGHRLEGVLRDIARRHLDATIVVVCHGGVTIDMARNLIGDQLVQELAPGVIEAGLSPCSITEIVQDSDGLTVVSSGRSGWKSAST